MIFDMFSFWWPGANEGGTSQSFSRPFFYRACLCLFACTVFVQIGGFGPVMLKPCCSKLCRIVAAGWFVLHQPLRSTPKTSSPWNSSVLNHRHHPPNYSLDLRCRRRVDRVPKRMRHIPMFNNVRLSTYLYLPYSSSFAGRPPLVIP